MDKRVPIAVIVAIIGQTVVGVAWLATLGERVTALERTEITRSAAAPVSADRLTRVEVNVEHIKSSVDEIKRLIVRQP